MENSQDLHISDSQGSDGDDDGGISSGSNTPLRINEGGNQYGYN